MLTSQAREALAGVETVILDEVHAVAGTKRGAHLALTLERLDALLEQPGPADRAVRHRRAGRRRWPATSPVAARSRSCSRRRPRSGTSTSSSRSPTCPRSARSSRTTCPARRPAPSAAAVDLAARRGADRRPRRRRTARPSSSPTPAGSPSGSPPGSTRSGRSGSSRARGAGATSRAEPRRGRVGSRTPAQLMAQSGASSGAPAGARPRPPRLGEQGAARAHRGGPQGRAAARRRGDQLASSWASTWAPSTSSSRSSHRRRWRRGLQRVGRAGHQVGAVSRGRALPEVPRRPGADRRRRRADAGRRHRVAARAGQPGRRARPADRGDVRPGRVDRRRPRAAGAPGRRRSPRCRARSSSRCSTCSSGRYPSDEFAELRPRIVWDRVTGVLTGRPGAQRLAVTSGGTIPDRGLYAVFLASGEGAGRRVGELDEEMVYESRVGDVFTLGTSTWRIEDITHDRVLVTPAPGLPGRLPFWKGDQLGRPGRAGPGRRGVRPRGRRADARAKARARVTAAGLDEWAADNLLAYLDEQREATRHVPDDRTIVVERFRDEIGDWRVAVHSPFGGQVHAPWALCVVGADARAVRRRRAGHARRRRHRASGCPTSSSRTTAVPAAASAPSCSSWCGSTPTTCTTWSPPRSAGPPCSRPASGSARPGPCCSPAAAPTGASPCGSSASGPPSCSRWPASTPSFPIVLETVRECVQDVFDVPGLTALMRVDRVARGHRSSTSSRRSPSPFARSPDVRLRRAVPLRGRLAAGRAARRRPRPRPDPAGRAARPRRGALAARPARPGRGDAAPSPSCSAWSPSARCRDAEDVADLLRVLGPLPLDAIQAPVRGHPDPPARSAAGWSSWRAPAG